MRNFTKPFLLLIFLLAGGIASKGQVSLSVFIDGILYPSGSGNQVVTVNKYWCNNASLGISASGFIQETGVANPTSGLDSVVIIGNGFRGIGSVILTPDLVDLTVYKFCVKGYMGNTVEQTDSFLVKVWNLPFFPEPVLNIPGIQYSCGTAISFSIVPNPNYPTLEYLWNDGNTNTSRTLSPGNYNVVAHKPGDPNCFSASATVVIDDMTQWNTEISVEGSLALCPNGSVELAPRNSFPLGGTITWSNGATSNSISANTAGNYSFTWTHPDAGCNFQSETLTVTQPKYPAPIVSGVNSICGQSTATLTASSTFIYDNFEWDGAQQLGPDLIIAGGGSYRVRGISGQCFSDWSIPFVVTQTAGSCNLNIWNGTGVWTTAANWSLGAPPVDTNRVLINTGTIQMNENLPITFKALEIASGAIANLNSTYLILKDSLVNYGTLNGGIYTFNNSNATSFKINTEGGISKIKFFSFSQNTPVNHIGNPIVVTGGASFGDAVFTTNSKLILDAENALNEPPYFYPNNSGRYVGQIEVKSYLNPTQAQANGAWKLVASPIASSVPLTMLEKGGLNPFASATFDPAVPTNSSLYTYDPTNNNIPSNQGYTKIFGRNSNFVNGNGYRAWINSNTFNAANNNFLSYSGTPFLGNKVLNLNYCNSNCPYSPINGWNLIGNPFVSAISWQFGFDYVQTNVTNTIYKFVSNNNTWATYQRGVGGVNGGTPMIYPGEGFFVEATAAGASLEIKESATSTYIFGVEAPVVGGTNSTIKGRLRAKLKATNGFDEVLLADNSQAVKAYTVNEDSKKMFGGSISLAIETGGPAQSIAQWNITPLDTIWLSLSAASAGNYNLNLEPNGSFSQASYYLADPSTGMIFPVMPNQDIPLFVDNQPRRVAILVVNASVSALPQYVSSKRVAVFPNPANGLAEIQLDETASSVWLTDVSGKKVLEVGNDLRSARFSVSDLPSGIYMVNAQLKSGLVRQKLSVTNF